MATRARRQVEDFDVTDFMRRDDQDMKSAISSMLGDRPDVVSEQEEPTLETTPHQPPPLAEAPSGELVEAVSPVPFPKDDESRNLSEVGSSAQTPSVSSPIAQTATRQERFPKRGIPRVERSSFDLSYHVKRATEAFRLNTSEIAIYKTFLKWTHLNGVTRCQATNPKISEASGIAEKSVRRNLKSLKKRGLIIQVNEYNPVTHAPAFFDVYLPVLAPQGADKL